MGFWDRLMGREEPASYQAPASAPGLSGRSEDDVAIERYRYLLRTAPPETIEQVHEEAFAKLTPEQRASVYRELSANAAPGDQPLADDPRALARSATRSELRNPGTMERAFAGRGPGQGGPSFGSMVGSSLLGTVAGYVIASAIAGTFFAPTGGEAVGDQGGDAVDNAADSGGDAGSSDYSADSGGDFGGDFGGGDFGGGDFGF